MLNRLPLIYIVCVIVVFQAGCAGTVKQSSSGSRQISKATPSLPDSKQQSSIYRRLNSQYSRWKGTPYKLGGLNKRGIDCSGFVHVTFRDAFGIKLPRTTERLAETGTKINKHQLDVGDLVFFKTGFSKRHVGIYIGNQQFIHASTSNGVMKSNLDNPYWSQHYWRSTRLLVN